MDVQEVRGLDRLEIRGSLDRQLHGVDIGEDLRRRRTDLASGFLVGLGTSQGPGIHLHALDLRGGDGLGAQQQSREWHQLGPSCTVQIGDRLLGVRHDAGDSAWKGDVDARNRLGHEGVVLARTSIARRRIGRRVGLPGFVDVPPSHRDPFLGSTVRKG